MDGAPPRHRPTRSVIWTDLPATRIMEKMRGKIDGAALLGQLAQGGGGLWADGRFVEAAIWAVVLLVLLAGAAYLLKKLRSEPEKKVSSASRLMADFRNAHSRGELTDEEFRAIKTMLADELERELNGKDQTG